jgi:hypothetical protein
MYLYIKRKTDSMLKLRVFYLPGCVTWGKCLNTRKHNLVLYKMEIIRYMLYRGLQEFRFSTLNICSTKLPYAVCIQRMLSLRIITIVVNSHDGLCYNIYPCAFCQHPRQRASSLCHRQDSCSKSQSPQAMWLHSYLGHSSVVFFTQALVGRV